MWAFQAVLNSGLQVLLSIAAGCVVARLRLADPDVLSRSINLFAMKVAFPAFILHLLGIKTNLRDAEAWRALGVFVLWALLIQLGCLAWHAACRRWRRGGSSLQQLGLNAMLLSVNNTGVIGWPLLVSAVGNQHAMLSMLLGLLFFIQLLPFPITCFELAKFIYDRDKLAASGGVELQASDTQAHRGADQAGPRRAAASVVLSSFPGAFRYSYWSTRSAAEVFAPGGPSYSSLPSSADAAAPAVPADLRAPAGAGQCPVCLLEVCVDCGSSNEEVPDAQLEQHHCFGSGGSSRSNGGAAAYGSTAPAAPEGQEWWRGGRRPTGWPSGGGAASSGGGGLKRAKDSCESLSLASPFAAAAASAPGAAAAAVQGGAQLRPGGTGLSTLTRRLSSSTRGLGAQLSMAAASAGSLMRAASLKKAGSTSVRRPSGALPAGTGAAAREPRCQLSVPLMQEHADIAASCCPSHRRDSGAEAAAAAAAAGPPPASATSPVAATAAASQPADPAAAGPAPAAAQAGAAAATSRARRAGSLGLAGDSAVELHRMCDAAPACEGCCVAHTPAAAAACSASACPSGQHESAPAAPATQRGPAPGAWPGLRSSSTTSVGSAVGRISSATALLPAAGGGAVPQGASRLSGKAVSAGGGSATRSAAGSAAAKPAPGLLRRFVLAHPMLTRIVTLQLQSFHLWTNVLAIGLSLSGARAYLDADSPAYLPAIGWLDGVLASFSSACIPTLLFANGVWLEGKRIITSWEAQLQVLVLLLLKMLVLPLLMVALTLVCGLRGPHGLSLVLLASCPLAPLAFLVAQDYSYGAELATALMVQQVLLMLPQMIGVIKLSQALHLYHA